MGNQSSFHCFRVWWNMEQAKLFQLLGFLTLIGHVQMAAIGGNENILLEEEDNATLNHVGGAELADIPSRTLEQEMPDEVSRKELQTPHETSRGFAESRGTPSWCHTNSLSSSCWCYTFEGKHCSRSFQYGGCGGEHNGVPWCWTAGAGAGWGYCYPGDCIKYGSEEWKIKEGVG